MRGSTVLNFSLLVRVPWRNDLAPKFGDASASWEKLKTCETHLQKEKRGERGGEREKEMEKGREWVSERRRETGKGKRERERERKGEKEESWRSKERGKE